MTTDEALKLLTDSVGKDISLAEVNPYSSVKPLTGKLDAVHLDEKNKDLIHFVLVKGEQRSRFAFKNDGEIICHNGRNPGMSFMYKPNYWCYISIL